MVLTTISAVTFLVVFLADLFGLHTNPYIGILFFLILPSLFLFGLALIPIGAWSERRRRAAGKPPAELEWPRVDLNLPSQRRTAVMIFALTLVNIIIVSLAAYRGVEYMDSVQFCGQVCHDVMKPEFQAYQDGPHSRVTCVQCHIGPGASFFAKAKISGMRQVLAVARNSYSRPIASPVQNLRPAREVCEQCHWPEKFHGDKIRRVYEYGDDEKNTESATTLTVHVGGGSQKMGTATGIHWHMNVANEIEYITTDDKRQVIPYVRMKDRLGNVREYFAEGVTPEQLSKGERRRMDCMDCHNRPAHPMAATAERAVDEAMARGEIPQALPFVRREAVRALKADYPSQDVAVEQIASTLREFYRTQHNAVYMSKRQDVEKAVSAAGSEYRRNVFPEMNVRFGTYLNNIGHMDSPGCFRCHDDSHKTKEGKAIGQECDTCHTVE
ncbi:MAG TPA: NapC/NirT family cytochrome c [Vicinamibacterales bacterium]|nr:NapC/NirT family cytochrome c [Vicinamibacterales bacterium]